MVHIKRHEFTRFFILAVMTVAVFALIDLILFLTQHTGTNLALTSEKEATKLLNKLYKKIQVNTLPPLKGNVDLETMEIVHSLPEISTYPAQVDNTTPDFIEIFSSTEKATIADEGNDFDRWFIDMAEAFNHSGAVVNGKPVSVRIRGISSGQGIEYIRSGKYVPDAYSPSHELWGEILKSGNIDIMLVEHRLAGNVAGIALTKKKHAEIIEKYGSVTLSSIIEAVSAGEIVMGYTNPLTSSTGTNFLISTLFAIDRENPLSSTAANAFENFQQNIPFVAYSTLQMKRAAKSGALEGFVFEYQQFANAPDLQSEYIFTPFGMRHDNPIYALGQLSDMKQEIMRQFILFTQKEESQSLATQYGFNAYDDYVSEIPSIEDSTLDGILLHQAQNLWKEKKSSNRETIAVFVADISESIEGELLHKLKSSLLSGAKSIGPECSVGLVTFSDKVNIAVPIAKFDLNQRSLYIGAVENMRGGGNSAMFDAIMVAEKMLMDAKADAPGARLLIFVLTDGNANTGSTFQDTRGIIEGLGVPIYTIGFNADMTLLTKISEINEAISIDASTSDICCQFQELFNCGPQ